jgi:aryl-alcohol dehydrogenase-like predicted oxidoreductase
MRYSWRMGARVLEKLNCKIRPVGVGCWQFGGAITIDGLPDGWTGVNDGESLATIARAVELGVTFFDTADMYGWGHSEELLGRALKDTGARDRVVVATKVGFWRDDAGRRTLNESRGYVLSACDASLRRLQTDRIDLYQCHLGRTERWAEFLDAFETLQQAGKIRAFGVSSNDLGLVQHFNAHGNLAAVQANYNLLAREAEKELLPYCQAHGIAFIARGPLAMGRLSGKYTRDSRFDPNEIRSKWLSPENRSWFERDMERIERLKEAAARLKLTLPELAIVFLLSNPAVSVVIVGVKNRAQLEQNVAAAFLPPLTHDQIKAINQ